jgi:hypothetical protein
VWESFARLSQKLNYSVCLRFYHGQPDDNAHNDMALLTLFLYVCHIDRNASGNRQNRGYGFHAGQQLAHARNRPRCLAGSRSGLDRPVAVSRVHSASLVWSTDTDLNRRSNRRTTVEQNELRSAYNDSVVDSKCSGPPADLHGGPALELRLESRCSVQILRDQAF